MNEQERFEMEARLLNNIKDKNFAFVATQAYLDLYQLREYELECDQRKYHSPFYHRGIDINKWLVDNANTSDLFHIVLSPKGNELDRIAMIIFALQLIQNIIIRPKQ